MKNEDKIILHLCADTGSDSYYYKEAGYDVRLIGIDIGVENFRLNKKERIYGVIANPVCTEFSTARIGGKCGDTEKGMGLVREC